MFDTNKQKTYSMECIIFGYLVGHNYGDVIKDMQEALKIDHDNSVFDIALSNLQDKKIIDVWTRTLTGEVWASITESGF